MFHHYYSQFYTLSTGKSVATLVDIMNRELSKIIERLH